MKEQLARQLSPQNATWSAGKFYKYVRGLYPPDKSYIASKYVCIRIQNRYIYTVFDRLL